MKKFFLILMVGIFLLTACTAPAAPATEPAKPAETDAAAPVEPAAPASGDLYVVKMIQWPGPESDAMQKVIDWFNENKAQEAGFKVEMLLFGRDQMNQKQEAIMASGSGDVDIFYVPSRSLGKYHTFLDPLDDYLADPATNPWGAKAEDWMPSAIQGVSWFDGKQYAVPRDISAHFMYYRKDLIDQLLTDAAWQETFKKVSAENMGVEMTPKHPDEWTWDDYLATSYFFTKKYNPDSPTEYGNFTHGKVMGPTAFLWTNAYWSFGGDWFDKDGNVSFDNDAAKAALEVWKTSFSKELTPASSINGEYPEDNEAMMAGQVAMTVHWNAAYDTVNGKDSPTADKWGVAAPPAGPEGRFVYNHTLALSLNKTSTHKTEAAKWLTYLLTEEAARMYAEAGGIPPHPKVLGEMATEYPGFGIMSDLVAKFGRALPPTAGIIEVMTCEALSTAWSGEKEIDVALTDLQAAAEAEMANWK